MRVLIVCPHYTPDLQAATGDIVTRLVEHLAKRNVEATVVTSLPWYRRRQVEPEWTGKLVRREKAAWGEIIRVWPFATKKKSIVARLVGFLGFTVLATLFGMRVKRPDVVLAVSPPIFMGTAGWVLAKRWRVPLVFNVQDIFPDVAIELGALNSKPVIAAAKKLETFTYSRSDAITVLSEDQATNISAKLKEADRNKLHIIENTFDLNKVKPIGKENAYRERNNLLQKTVVMYSGNVGLSQPFELIRYAAEELKNEQDLVFVINGEGATRSEVDEWAQAMPNVLAVDYSPQSELEIVLGAADLQLILLKTGLAKSSTPSKLYAILSAGRPVLASLDQSSEVAQVVEKAEAGMTVPPDDPEAFVSALAKMLQDRSELERLGRNGRKYAETLLSPEEQAEMYEQTFQAVIEAS